MTFEIGQRFFPIGASALLLVKEDGQGAKQGQVARRHRITHLATVLGRSSIPPVVLSVFNGPMVAQPLEQSLGRSLCGAETGNGAGDFALGGDDLALADGLADAFDPDDLARAGQT